MVMFVKLINYKLKDHKEIGLERLNKILGKQWWQIKLS